MSEGVTQSGTRSRTRRAIIDAAVTVLARHRAATLADIAEKADIGRSTLHRYFADRDELIREAVDESFHAISESVREAALTQGSAIEATRRLVAALINCDDQLRFLFRDPVVMDSIITGEDDPTDNDIIQLIKRGQQEGTFDVELSPVWIMNTIWALVYTGCEVAQDGSMPRHGVLPAVIRTLENGIRSRSPRADLS